jgi:hypothetical protein
LGVWAPSSRLSPSRDTFGFPRDRPDHDESDLADVAFHEAGHAVVVHWAFATAKWLPNPRPPQPVRFFAIRNDGTGTCASARIYVPGMMPVHIDLIERQIVADLAGGVAEARARRENVSVSRCEMLDDWRKAWP